MRRAQAGLLCLAALVAFARVAAADPAEEIAYLIGLVRGSDCTFIRNGSEYSGATAADHVQEKYEYFRREIFSAEDFIDKAASKSALSGKPYQIRCPGQAVETSAAWLRAQLKAHRNDSTSP